MTTIRISCVLLAFSLLASSPGFGWGKDGHKLVNRVAVEMLPPGLPAFLRTPQAIEEIRYLGPEPDRWRSPAEPELNAAQAPEHFLDLEMADLASPAGLPSRRFDYLVDLERAQKRDPALASKLTPQTVGLLPWQMDEYFERLRADMRQYRVRLAEHKPLQGAELAVVYDAGVLGHYAADGSQPLHTSINYNGWAQRDNPEGFTREHHIHSQFESDFVHDNLRARNVLPLVPRTPRMLDSPFDEIVIYLRTSHAQVNQVYRFEKQGALEGKGTAESRAFTAERLAAGATMLRDLIYTAWISSGEMPLGDVASSTLRKPAVVSAN